MTIDPDDYDLRELRRIADERRDARRTEGERDRRRPEGDRRRGESDRRRDGDDRRRSGNNRRRGDGDRSGGDDGRSARGGRDRRRGRSDRRGGDGEDGDRTRREGRRSGRSKGDRRRSRSDERRRNGRSEDEKQGRSGRTEDRTDSGDRRDGEEQATVRPRNGVSRPRQGGSDHAEGHDEVLRADQIARDLGFGDDRSRRDERGRRGDGRVGTDRGHPDAGGRRPRRDSADDVGQFQFDTEVRERPRGRAGEALRQNQLEQLLVHETAAAGEGLSKPYLTDLPDEYAAERTVFDWLEFLVLKGGFKRTMDALRYYHTVDWLTEEVEAELQDYLVGFSGEVSDTSEFDVDDHHLSLVYIARLASMS